MLRSTILASLTLALAAPPVLAAQAPPASLARSTKWEINYDEDSCTLAARFGEGKDSVLMAMTKAGPGNWFELKLYGKAFSYGRILMPVDLGFGSQPLARYQGLSATSSGKEKTPTLMLSMIRLDGWRYPKPSDPPSAPPAISPEQEAAVNSLTVKPVGKKPLELRTGSMGPPMAAMRTCVDDLMRHWGFDPAVQAGLTKQTLPLNNPGNWLGTNDFPFKSLMKGHNGLVRFRLDVEADGKVSACRILYRTNPDEFADLSCKLLMQRAKMAPALDAQGKPVRSFYISQIRWQAGEW